MARRAFASEDKLARRQVILDAARQLFAAGGGGLPSAAQIAEAAGLAKGTVYLYFRTKEEIFAALLLSDWSLVMADACTAFSGTSGQGGKVAAFLSAFAGYLDAHPELLRLDALGYGVLEQNMGEDGLRAFKSTLVERLNEAGAVIDGALGQKQGRGFRLLMRTYAMTRGLWQSTQPGPDSASVLADATVAQLYPPFGAELRDALREYWQGALMEAETSPAGGKVAG